MFDALSSIPDKKIFTSSNRKKSETVEKTYGCKNRVKCNEKKEEVLKRGH